MRAVNTHQPHMFFEAALDCSNLALGADKITFAVDYPYLDNDEAVQFI
jgi:hypothetical protein